MNLIKIAAPGFILEFLTLSTRKDSKLRKYERISMDANHLSKKIVKTHTK